MIGNRQFLASGVVVLSLVTTATPIAAQGTKASRTAEPRVTVHAEATVVFGDAHRDRFREYVRVHSITAKPLPPGVMKRLARGKPLPPGIAKRALPAGMLALAPQAPDVSFVLVGDVVVATRGGLVIDVLFGVFD